MDSNDSLLLVGSVALGMGIGMLIQYYLDKIKYKLYLKDRAILFGSLRDMAKLMKMLVDHIDKIDSYITKDGSK